MTSTDRTDAVIVLTTIGSAEQAQLIARTLVAERLAACVNLLAEMTSFYRWEGDVQEDREWQLIIKTTRQKVGALRERLHALHTYEVPEFLVLAIEDGSAAYLHWMAESTSASS
jgi:periplasmic divalent cation tolerance protein